MLDTAIEIQGLVDRLRGGDSSALAGLFSHYRERLRRMIEVRLDQRLGGRISASDVLQETFLDATKRVPHFARKPDLPFYVWLRMVTGQRLAEVHRQHLGAQMRSMGHEVSIDRPFLACASSPCLAANLVGQLTSPSHAARRNELLKQVEGARWNGSMPATGKYWHCGTSKSSATTKWLRFWAFRKRPPASAMCVRCSG